MNILMITIILGDKGDLNCFGCDSLSLILQRSLQIFSWSFDCLHLWQAKKLGRERRLHLFHTGSPFRDISLSAFIFLSGAFYADTSLSVFSCPDLSLVLILRVS